LFQSVELLHPIVVYQSNTIRQLINVVTGVPVKPVEETDQQLVERVKRGDKRAYELLVLKYQHKIIGLVGRYLRDQDEVLDVTQEAFIKAYKALPRFRGDSAFYTWLFRIAINTAKNHLVSRSRRPPDVDIDVDDGDYLDPTLSDIASPEAKLVSAELEQVVYKAIEDLPEELKVAVTLREFEGLSYEDIAQVMECPVGTVRSRIFRAREAIEKKITEIG
jgi:RNA polymerase sigma-70 factor (ECF subfamily)